MKEFLEIIIFPYIVFKTYSNTEAKNENFWKLNAIVFGSVDYLFDVNYFCKFFVYIIRYQSYIYIFNFGFVEILNFMQIISTTFHLNILLVWMYFFYLILELSCPSISPNFLLSTENVVSTNKLRMGCPFFIISADSSYLILYLLV